MTTPPEEPQVPEGSAVPPPPPAAPTPPPAAAATTPPSFATITAYFEPEGPLDDLSTKLGWAILGIGAVSFVAAFLPWYTAFGLSAAGTEDEGWLTIILGLAAIVLGLARARAGKLLKPTAIFSAAAGALITLIAIIDMSDTSGNLVGVGFGLVLTLIAGIAFIAVGAFALIKNK